MANEIKLKRRTAGAVGAPVALKSGELAWNQVDDTIYGGKGDDGGGNATSVVPVGGEGHFAKKDSPALTGTPTAPTPAGGDNTTKLATTAFVQNAVGAAGGGDMLKSVYDGNDDGKVDAADTADAVPWTGVTGKPAEFAPADHDAAKITTGTIDPARLPATVFSAPVVSSGAIADVTAPQEADIVAGTVVVTTDGRRWTYSGTGDKTLEASYTEMADVTPEWSVIANKPSTFAPSAHTHTLADVSDAGSMAGQDSDNVAITGGAINGITLDGGTF
ncbi:MULTISPECIES: hypothetical protein [Hyphomonas]|uniref:Major tropism determinant N-terminal domain-containing protein n=1 Tax=Hyphomonas adhaerens TaxID=81029 RepID=A0A3B9GXS5_9PROT|nr:MULTISPECIES: hypothetical protein [Hyphomonas]MBB40948.1 hypothetical protein [Hyphomonas sp.]HAE27016.1 hypothetical protein [Hyphomonas adhaerens]|tara:strand:+ start:6186 stop:7010 length:825 start_codon:yes stop_codon:yes gene_type:complete